MTRGSWRHRPRAQLAKYSAIAGVTTRTNLAYLADFFLRGIFLVVVMFVFVQLWRTTYGATGEARIGGFSLAEMIWYLAITESITMSFPRLSDTVDRQVKSGELAYALGRPHSYILYLFSTYLGETVVRFPVNLLIAGAVAFLSVGPPPVVLASVPGFLVAVFLALALNFVLMAGIGLLAFWFEDTSSFALLYSRFLMIAGGMLLPLDVFPVAIRRLTLALPTNLIIYGPARLFAGQGTGAPEVWSLLGRQTLWLAIFGLVLGGLFRLGVKRVSVHGG